MPLLNLPPVPNRVAAMEGETAAFRIGFTAAGPSRSPCPLEALFGMMIVLLLAVGCDAAPSEPDDRVVEGVNVTALFAPPSDAERALVEADWAERDPSAEAFRLERSDAWSLGDASADLRVVSHVVDGNRHYGLVLVPRGFSDAELPVLVYAHGGDGGVGAEELVAVAGAMQATGADFVYVAPSFRSEPLRHPAGSFLSEGEPSPWDRDVDDAMALLTGVIENVSEADPERVGVLGVSRGGGVALLMGIRDARVDAVVNFFGPTDFFDVYVQEVVEEALRAVPRSLPGLDHLDRVLIQPLKEGTLEMEAVRLELVRRSAVLFAERLPPLQVHHGTADPVVSVSQANSLRLALESLGRTPPDYEVFLYSGAGHNPAEMPLALPRAFDFLERIR